jgi:hypothetical protein
MEHPIPAEIVGGFLYSPSERVITTITTCTKATIGMGFGGIISIHPNGLFGYYTNWD